MVQNIIFSCIKPGCRFWGARFTRTNPASILEGLKLVPKVATKTSKKIKPLPQYSSISICTSHKSGGGLCSFPDYMPKDYIIRDRSNYVYTPHYVLDKLWAKEKGNGTSGLQSVVSKSLSDENTCGRVMLEAACEDGITAPGGFYYKLGFRFVNPLHNKECEQWLKMGGKYEDAPFAIGRMYLPKENIEHCLKYGYTEEEFNKYILPNIEPYLKTVLDKR